MGKWDPISIALVFQKAVRIQGSQENLPSKMFNTGTEFFKG